MLIIAAVALYPPLLSGYGWIDGTLMLWGALMPVAILLRPFVGLVRGGRTRRSRVATWKFSWSGFRRSRGIRGDLLAIALFFLASAAVVVFYTNVVSWESLLMGVGFGAVVGGAFRMAIRRFAGDEGEESDEQRGYPKADESSIEPVGSLPRWVSRVDQVLFVAACVYAYILVPVLINRLSASMWVASAVVVCSVAIGALIWGRLKASIGPQIDVGVDGS